MAAWHAADVEPPVVRLGEANAEVVVVGVGTSDQDLPPTGQNVAEQARFIFSMLMVVSHTEDGSA
jgi:hypothetical protein